MIIYLNHWKNHFWKKYGVSPNACPVQNSPFYTLAYKTYSICRLQGHFPHGTRRWLQFRLPHSSVLAGKQVGRQVTAAEYALNPWAPQFLTPCSCIVSLPSNRFEELHVFFFSLLDDIVSLLRPFRFGFLHFKRLIFYIRSVEAVDVSAHDSGLDEVATSYVTGTDFERGDELNGFTFVFTGF